MRQIRAARLGCSATHRSGAQPLADPERKLEGLPARGGCVRANAASRDTFGRDWFVLPEAGGPSSLPTADLKPRGLIQTETFKPRESVRVRDIFLRGAAVLFRLCALKPSLSARRAARSGSVGDDFSHIQPVADAAVPFLRCCSLHDEQPEQPQHAGGLPPLSVPRGPLQPA